MTSLDRPRSLLAATTAQLHAEFGALGEEGAAFHKAPGEWCAKEVLGHLIEAERRGFAGRIAQILAGDRPELDGWDQAGVAAARSDCDRDWQELLAEFEAGRTAGLALVGRLTDPDLDRVGIHPDVGELTIRDVLNEWPFHDRDHLRQIFENTRALLWPGLGGAQQFTFLHGQSPP